MTERIDASTKLKYYLYDKYEPCFLRRSTVGRMAKNGYSPFKIFTCQDCGFGKIISEYGKNEPCYCRGDKGEYSYKRYDKNVGCLSPSLEPSLHKEFHDWMVYDGNNYDRVGRLIQLSNGQIWLFIHKENIDAYRYNKAHPSYSSNWDWRIANADRPAYAGPGGSN